MSEHLSTAVPLVLVFDDRHARHASVVLQSASKSLAGGYAVDAHLIVDGLSRRSEAGLHRVEESTSNLSLTLHKSDASRYGSWPHSGHVPPASYLRLELAEHLDDVLDRVIYIDTDVLIIDSIHKLLHPTSEAIPSELCEVD
jgi:lipopolysaccharide biosynthesis glycosyltransferase